jgi:hypothetical protein
MPARIVEHVARTLNEYTRILEEVFPEGTLWFRGVSDASYLLTPSLYRHASKDDPAAMHTIEKEIYNTFAQRGTYLVGKDLLNTPELIFLLQHYRVPTRLLDWSENPFIALYFALLNLSSERDCAVWILNPIEWNTKMTMGTTKKLPHTTKKISVIII